MQVQCAFVHTQLFSPKSESYLNHLIELHFYHHDKHPPVTGITPLPPPLPHHHQSQYLIRCEAHARPFKHD